MDQKRRSQLLHYRLYIFTVPPSRRERHQFPIKIEKHSARRFETSCTVSVGAYLVTRGRNA